MQQLQTRKPSVAHKLTHRLLLKGLSSQNSPPYAKSNSNLSQSTEVQQQIQP